MAAFIKQNQTLKIFIWACLTTGLTPFQPQAAAAPPSAEEACEFILRDALTAPSEQASAKWVHSVAKEIQTQQDKPALERDDREIITIALAKPFLTSLKEVINQALIVHEVKFENLVAENGELDEIELPRTLALNLLAHIQQAFSQNADLSYKDILLLSANANLVLRALLSTDAEAIEKIAEISSTGLSDLGDLDDLVESFRGIYVPVVFMPEPKAVLEFMAENLRIMPILPTQSLALLRKTVQPSIWLNFEEYYLNRNMFNREVYRDLLAQENNDNDDATIRNYRETPDAAESKRLVKDIAKMIAGTKAEFQEFVWQYMFYNFISSGLALNIHNLSVTFKPLPYTEITKGRKVKKMSNPFLEFTTWAKSSRNPYIEYSEKAQSFAPESQRKHFAEFESMIKNYLKKNAKLQEDAYFYNPR